MKKAIIIPLSIILILIIACIILWTNRENIVAHYISKSLNNTPVSIKKIKYKNQIFMIRDLFIGNPRGSKTKTAFSSKTIDIDASYKALRAKNMVIESIELSDIFIGIEMYNESGSQNNWSKILKKDPSKKDTEGRHYLIKKLTLRNLTIVVTDSQGRQTRYPSLDHMVFYNISDKTGFPIEEIEKAIFNLVLQQVMKEYGLEFLQKTLKKFLPLPIFGD